MNRDEMLQHIQDKCGLASIYLEDGAPASAARVLDELAKSVHDFADAVQVNLERIMNNENS